MTYLWYARSHIYQVEHILFPARKERKEFIMALTEAGAAVISGALSAAGAASGATMGILTKKKKRHAKDMAKLQHQYEKERMEWGEALALRLGEKEQQYAKDMFDYQFDKQSEWQSEKAQVKRLKEAGLNPALMYSNGAGGGGGVSASADGASIDNPGVPQPMALQVYNQTLQAQAQRDLITSQAAVNFAEAAKKTGIDTIAGQKNVEEANSRILLNKATEAKTAAEIGKVASETSLLAQDIRIKTVNADISEATKEIEINKVGEVYRNLTASTNKMFAEAQLDESRKKLVDKEIGAFNEKLKALLEEVEAKKITARAAASQAESVASKTSAEVVKILKEASIKDIEEIQKYFDLGVDIIDIVVGGRGTKLIKVVKKIF